MLLIGLTGGLASGKSFVGRELARLGCLLIRADDLGHRVMEPDGEAYNAIIAEFSEQILDSSGKIDRRALARNVFANPERLAKLNSIVHPPVRALGQKIAEEFAANHPDGIAVYEAAILVETGSYREYAKLIVAACEEWQQIERAMSRDHLSRQEVLDRMSRQMPLKEKVKYADYVIDTSGSKEHTLEQTRSVYASLLETSRGV